MKAKEAEAFPSLLTISPVIAWNKISNNLHTNEGL